MAKLHDLVTVETTYEVSEKGWNYRIIVDREQKALIKRTCESNPLWSHSLFMEIFSPVENKFVPAYQSDIRNSRVNWNTVIQIINQQEHVKA